jgi:hypothetical protein
LAAFFMLGLAACAATEPVIQPVVRASPPPVQRACALRGTALENLAGRYQEVPVAAGITNQGALVEVLTTDDGRTWTIIITTPQGISCLVAAGEGWRQVKPARPQGTGA